MSSAAPSLPHSLTPHLCVLPSQDLKDLLKASSLPSLPRILQSFSPLSQITTRTTTLTPVTHALFGLRFSDLTEIEESCREPEEQRAERTIDWIGARIAQKSAKWLEDWDGSGAAARERDGDPNVRPPWWDELRQCVEGERVPSRVEGWNHPVAIIVAVSTLAPNPLQALAQLHSRPPDLPRWVDSANLRYTLIVHPKDSLLSNEEAGALFNAVKRQYGLHTFLLALDLSGEVQQPVSMPPSLPCLPPPRQGNVTTPDTGIADASSELENGILLSDSDIQKIAKFVREMVTTSLTPWMEKCVMEWNENFSSTRRLPSRLFSSTRRLFGSSPASPVSGQSAAGVPIARTHSLSGSTSSGPGFPQWATTFPQQRRLAEFATILGDFKLAIPVWESARRESRGGSEILPLLLSPTPATVLHVQHALSTITAPGAELTPAGQLRALMYAIRWAADEPPLALLLAHAASLSVRKWSTRRAALWYLLAANRLEKSGIKSLTVHFLRRAHQLYLQPHDKNLSPSFWEADGIEPTRIPGFDSIIPGIEYSLGRLRYTTGDVSGSVKFFLSILEASQKAGFQSTEGLDVTKAAMDKGALDDFRTAFQHLKETTGDCFSSSEFKLPITFCDYTKSRLRLAGDSIGGDACIWEAREESWRLFWRTRGNETLLKTGKAAVNEIFWVDLVLHNPLNVEINLSNLTLIVRDATDPRATTSVESVDVEVMADLALGAKETCTIPLSMRANAPGIYFITALYYEFLSLLPTREPVSTRGRRLHDTAIQRQTKVYAPDVFLKVEVEGAEQRLAVTFVDDGRLVLSHGECKELRLWLSNAGTESIDEVWLVSGPEEEFYFAADEDCGKAPSSESGFAASEAFLSNNSLQPPPPYRLQDISLQPGENTAFSIIFHAYRTGSHELCFLFAYRKQDGAPTFHSTRVSCSIEVERLVHVELRCRPSHRPESTFHVQAVISNASIQGTSIVLSQLSTISPTWLSTCSFVTEMDEVHSGQIIHASIEVDRDKTVASSPDHTQIFQFVSDRLKTVLLGSAVDKSSPPAVKLLHSHISSNPSHSFIDAQIRSLLHQSRRNATAAHITEQHPHIPPHLHPYIFPLYHPHAFDLVLGWAMPNEQRHGFILVPGPIIGASHGGLNAVIQEIEQMKVKRSMYAETLRERSSILEAIRNCEWNTEMNPVIATVQDLAVITHDFAEGPCSIPVIFTLRNFSLTRDATYTLKLSPPDRTALYAPSDPSPPAWAGRLTHSGNLGPMEHTTVKTELHVPCPDTYALEGWTLEWRLQAKTIGLEVMNLL
ncbi:ER-golgi trafficking TRAPP I complex 85 kDa subunit-domain-containing protein [Vararia minispora EC-137]|uniref:ER-golgi trafficking TRAPP I complex 85 kDa subunit-domain-containing protein n=1 Tax=Vararia minispora EC-137 TaxID=1314806 RepID=A0ACB8QY96_9AGAM|nr:ER-golgi trafficking TRAPP I complex 85 kDa subunit-domain-containing protein [Vararia minispora EC-137]